MSEGPRESGQLVFSLVLESRFRSLLEREVRDRKHGKSRKLTNADRAAIEEEVALFRFRPQKADVIIQEAIAPRAVPPPADARKSLTQEEVPPLEEK